MYLDDKIITLNIACSQDQVWNGCKRLGRSGRSWARTLPPVPEDHSCPSLEAIFEIKLGEDFPDDKYTYGHL
jgi:hypothetical protein